MINDQLRAVIDRALDRERISVEDVRELQREVFEYGLTCREEVNLLAALDRAVPTADPLWAKFFITSLVEFVVWTSRPTGYVDNETARWLVTALMPMDRATANAHRAALEILREAQQVDEEILPLLLTPREIAPSVPMHLAVLQPHRRPISPLTLPGARPPWVDGERLQSLVVNLRGFSHDLAGDCARSLP
jgi:hypothetical protein